MQKLKEKGTKLKNINGPFFFLIKRKVKLYDPQEQSFSPFLSTLNNPDSPHLSTSIKDSK